MARKPTKLTIVTNTSTGDLVNTAGTDIVLADTGACTLASMLMDAAEPAPCAAPRAPIVPSLAELEAMVQAAVDVSPLAESYTLAISGQYDSLIAAGMFAASYAKAIGIQVCVLGADGAPVRCYDPPIKRARGDKAAGVSSGPRGADWGSKSGQSIKLMMRDEGATMDEMKEITGWTFGQKYVNQLMRSFGVTITTRDATARTKRTWHASAVVSTPAEIDQTDDAGDHDMDAAASLMMAAE